MTAKSRSSSIRRSGRQAGDPRTRLSVDFVIGRWHGWGEPTFAELSGRHPRRRRGLSRLCT